MRLGWLIALFIVILAVQAITMTEAFGQPGTQIQMNANRPVYFVTN
jgi:hypothetical protein